MTMIFVVIGGLFIGVVSGLVGIGGGILMVPALVWGLHFSQHKAQGTSLVALLLPVGVFACWEYYKAGNVDIKVGLILALTLAIGAYFGAILAQHMSEVLLRRGFALLLVVAAVRLFLKS